MKLKVIPQSFLHLGKLQYIPIPVRLSVEQEEKEGQIRKIFMSKVKYK